MAYTRFVIVSHLRSGTHLLRTMLESHPQIVCQTEVFNSDNPNLPYPLSTATREILERWVYRPFPEEIHCAGFVLQAYHPFGLKAFPGIRENPLWADVWPLLEGTSGLRVIHLRRANLLRRHLSHILARKTGSWHDWDSDRVWNVSHIQQPSLRKPDRPSRPSVRLDPDRLRLDFEDVERLHRRVVFRFRHTPYFPLSYEDLCADPGKVGDELLSFLGVGVEALHPAVAKLENRPLAVSIENYDELRRAFAATRWQSFFADDASA
ncbi:MAG: hypothetical protein LJE70_17900 [Chromatiaceae bacterium]|nr:hypothetical protein [Chromatiaceae bacterium]